MVHLGLIHWDYENREKRRKSSQLADNKNNSIGLFEMHRRCTDRSVHDIKSTAIAIGELTTFEITRTLMSCTDLSVQCRCISNNPIVIHHEQMLTLKASLQYMILRLQTDFQDLRHNPRSQPNQHLIMSSSVTWSGPVSSSDRHHYIQQVVKISIWSLSSLLHKLIQPISADSINKSRNLQFHACICARKPFLRCCSRLPLDQTKLSFCV